MFKYGDLLRSLPREGLRTHVSTVVAAEFVVILCAEKRDEARHGKHMVGPFKLYCTIAVSDGDGR